jgi:hypothetical protein
MIIQIIYMYIKLDCIYEEKPATFGFLNLTSLKMLFSNSIHVPANYKISFFFMAE